MAEEFNGRFCRVEVTLFILCIYIEGCLKRRACASVKYNWQKIVFLPSGIEWIYCSQPC